MYRLNHVFRYAAGNKPLLCGKQSRIYAYSRSEVVLLRYPHQEVKKNTSPKKKRYLRGGADGADACVALDRELEVGQGKALEGEQLPADTGVGSLHESLDMRTYAGGERVKKESGKKKRVRASSEGGGGSMFITVGGRAFQPHRPIRLV